MAGLFHVLDRLENEPGRLAKEQILLEHKYQSLLQKTFLYAMDPFKTYGIGEVSVVSLPVGGDDMNLAMEAFFKLLDQLARRELTGNSAKGRVNSFLTNVGSPRAVKWMTRILLKNLRCGVTAVTVNKIWPGLVPQFGVQLANVLKGEPKKYPVIVDPKIDGLRLVAVKHNGSVRLFTRKGHEVETLPWITEALARAGYDNFVLDSEVMGIDWNHTQSVVASSKNIKEGDLKLNVFDCLPYDTWASQGESAPARDRRVEAATLVKGAIRSEHIQIVPWVIAYTDSEIRLQYEEHLRAGFEGAMVKDPEAPYCFKRSDAVLKVKPRETYTGVVVGYERGKGKYEGSIGALVVQVNGVETSVGTGLTDALRREIAEDPDSYVGKFVELESQEMTADGKLRFPVYKSFRAEVDL